MFPSPFQGNELKFVTGKNTTRFMTGNNSLKSRRTESIKSFLFIGIHGRKNSVRSFISAAVCTEYKELVNKKNDKIAILNREEPQAACEFLTVKKS